MTFSPSRPRAIPRWSLLVGVVAVMLLIGTQIASAAITSIPSNFFVVTDSGEANDVPGQVDLTRMGRDDTDSTKYRLFWSWDSISAWTGTGQTGDACALFDTGTNGMIDVAVCARVSNLNANPNDPRLLPQDASRAVYLFTCTDKRNDRCSQPTANTNWTSADADAGVLGTRAKDNLITETDPFPLVGESAPNDTTLEVLISKSLIGNGRLVNVCSYPSAGNGGNNNPFDCIVTPGSGFLTITKDAGGSTQSFNYTVTPTPPGGNPIAVAGGSTSAARALPIGTASVQETVPSTWSLQSASCTVEGVSGTTGTLNTSTSTVSGITIASGKITACTFTNTRQTGKIELKKSWVGTGGQTTLQIGTSAGGSQTDSQLTGAAGAAPLTTGENTVNTGTYYVSETGGLDDYTTSLACVRDGTTTAVTVGANNSVSVGSGDDIVCTFTNTRQTGKIELKKSWVGTGGQTTLQIGTSAGGSQTDSQLTGAAGAAPLTTGENTVNTGTYYVSETGGLDDYTTSLACVRDGTATAVTVGANNSVSVGSGDDIVCTFTNTRQTGKIELIKSWVGTGGQTTLQIGTSVGGSQTDSQLTGAAGAAPLTTGENTVNTGTYYVSETGGLDDYTTSLACVRDGTATAVTVGANNSVSVGSGDDIVCTFTNTRQTGKIELIKSWVGTGGQTTLQIGTSVGGSQTDSQLTGAAGAAPLTTGENTVNTGTYYVSETGGLDDYTTSLACVRDGTATAVTVGANNSVSVGSGDDIVCTFTNTRRDFTVIVLVCEGDELYASKVEVGTSEETSLGSAPVGFEEADLCGLGGARFGVISGTTQVSVTIGAQAEPL